MADMTGQPAALAFKKSVAREYLESIVVAVILALFIRTFAVQAFKIPTGSMIPNLLIGDHLIVNKLVYSPSFGPLESTLLGKREIRRGDVVVFKYPEDPSRDFIKRVIGLPGETIEVRGRQVLVDGKPIDEPYAHFLDQPLRPDDPEFAVREDGRDHWGPHSVPQGKLLVLGDNRDNSRDSRFWGFLPRDNVKGRALLVYWSYDADSQEYQETGAANWLKSTLSAFGRTRWQRFFHLIR
jgi:signal peptidase I